MSSLHTSGLKTSISGAAAVVLTALLAWSFESYTGHLQHRANQSVNTAQLDTGSSATDRDTRNG
jgi:hypothetical protein